LLPNCPRPLRLSTPRSVRSAIARRHAEDVPIGDGGLSSANVSLDRFGALAFLLSSDLRQRRVPAPNYLAVTAAALAALTAPAPQRGTGTGRSYPG